jgi:hypothetical protein
MRVMAIIKATEASERGQLPSMELLDEMGRFNAELEAAGILRGGDGLRPSSKGVRVHFSPDGSTSVTDGPFTETKELVSGFWLLEVETMEEAVAWMRKVPNTDGEHSEIELRQFVEPEDFGEAFTPEMQDAEDRMRDRLEARAAE